MIKMFTNVYCIVATRAKTLSQWRCYWLVVSLMAAVCSTLAKETGIVTFALCLLSDSDVIRLFQPSRSLAVLVFVMLYVF